MTPGRQQKTDVKRDAFTDKGVTVASRQRRAETTATIQTLNKTHGAKSQSGTHASEQRQNTTSDDRFTQTERLVQLQATLETSYMQEKHSDK